MPKSKKPSSKKQQPTTTAAVADAVADAPRQRRQLQKQMPKLDIAEAESDSDDAPAPSAPRVPSHVVRKLVVFSLLLLLMPIMVYFLSLKYVFVGKTAASAIAAVVAANFVLFAFVYAAWVEELEDREHDRKTKRE